jgi:hypothetical protein
MTDNDEQLYLVVCEIGPTCIEYGYRLEPLTDHVLCVDCSEVAKRAVLDGVDDQVVAAFRAWSPREKLQP